MACTDKMDLHRLTAANTKCSNESVDFVEHDVLPMAVRIDFQKKNRQKFNWINTILKLIIVIIIVFVQQTEKLYKRIVHGITKSTEDETYKNELQNYIQAAFNVIRYFACMTFLLSIPGIHSSL